MEKISEVTVPNWLLGDSLTPPPPKRKSKSAPAEQATTVQISDDPILVKARQERVIAEQLALTYEIFFENCLESIAEGRNLADLIAESPHGIKAGRFRTWMHKDKTRVSRMREAQAIGAEAIEDEIMRIIDATDSLEDVQRSKLKLEGRKFLLQTYAKDRYSQNPTPTNSMQGGITINIGAVDSPYSGGVTIDNEPVKVLTNG